MERWLLTIPLNSGRISNMKKWIVRILATIGGITLILTILGAVGNIYYAQTASEAPEQPIAQVVPDRPPTPEELLERVNIEREKVGVAPLKLDPLLNKSAQYKSDDMASRGYREHVDPETGLKNGLDYAVDITQSCVYISENIVGAELTNTIDDAMNNWTASNRHYQAMIDSRYELTGFGIAKTQYAYEITQHFCEVN